MKKTVVIKGMSCEHCKMAVETALKEIDGALSVSVDLAHGVAILESAKAIGDDVITAAVDEAGFDVTEII